MQKLIPALLALVASVIGLPEDMRDPTTWVVSTTALGGVIWAFVRFLRTNVLRNLDGVAVIFTSTALGGALAVIMGLGGFDGIGSTALEWLAFGLSAGFGATLIDQGVKKVTEGKAEARLEA